VPRLHGMVHYRIAVDGNLVETYVNDVRVSRHEFKEAPYPWFTLSANASSSRPILQNVRITGQPEIPTEVDLLSTDRLFSRISHYQEPEDESNQFSRSYSSSWRHSAPSDTWILKDDEVTSGSLAEDDQRRPIFLDSWVHYDRPMLEDGEFEFEMFADTKKKKLCHLLIGRTALLLKEDGVWQHEISRNDNEDIADQRIDGSKAVDLKDGDWNRVLLRLEGDKATLLINDAEVAKFNVVDTKSLRFPGLFRYADQSNAQVRKLKLRGNWPTALPPVDQQELAMLSTDPFDGLIAGETKTYDLTKSIDDLKSAGAEIDDFGQIQATAQGLKFTVRENGTPKKRPTVKLPVKAENDFDVSIDFTDLKIVKAKNWGCNFELQVNFNDAESSTISVCMKRNKTNDLFIQAQRGYDRPHGKRDTKDRFRLDEPFDNGSLRLVRHDGVIYCIAASEGKAQQVVGSYTVGKRPVDGISIVAKSATNSSELDALVQKIKVTVAK